ncbi:DUF4372 domain-containing protein [Treponema sp.]|uniref:DUF4372 domain-containing protein n=1 Tax=Treponema sp. TaxID=166 RepID=UPI00338EE852
MYRSRAVSSGRRLFKVGQLLAFVSRPQFENLVKSTQSDKHCKGFTAWQHFVTMSYAQLANPNGLRSLENSLNSNHSSLYHVAFKKTLNARQFHTRTTTGARTV